MLFRFQKVKSESKIVRIFPERVGSLHKAKIPTQVDVLGRLLFETTSNHLKISEATEKVACEVMAIWKTVRKAVKLRSQQDIIRLVELLREKYSRMKKHSNRHTQIQIERRESLNAEFNIAVDN